MSDVPSGQNTRSVTEKTKLLPKLERERSRSGSLSSFRSKAESGQTSEDLAKIEKLTEWLWHEDLYIVFPLIMFLSLLVGIVFYCTYNGWSIATSTFCATSTLIGAIYGVPGQPDNVGAVFTMAYYIYGVSLFTSVLGTVVGSMVTQAPHLAAQARRRMIEMEQPEDTDGDGEIGFWDNYIFWRFKLLHRIGWEEHYLIYTVTSASILWVFVGVAYGLYIEKWTFEHSLYFAINAVSEASLSVPDCDGPSPNDCEIGTFRGFALSLYLIIGVPLFTFSMAQYAGLLVKRAVRDHERTIIHQPLSEEEYNYAANLYGNDEVLSLGEFTVLELLRLQRVSMDDLEQIKNLFCAIDEAATGMVDKPMLAKRNLIQQYGGVTGTPPLFEYTLADDNTNIITEDNIDFYNQFRHHQHQHQHQQHYVGAGDFILGGGVGGAGDFTHHSLTGIVEEEAIIEDTSGAMSPGRTTAGNNSTISYKEGTYQNHTTDTGEEGGGNSHSTGVRTPPRMDYSAACDCHIGLQQQLQQHYRTEEEEEEEERLNNINNYNKNKNRSNKEVVTMLEGSSNVASTAVATAAAEGGGENGSGRHVLIKDEVDGMMIKTAFLDDYNLAQHNSLHKELSALGGGSAGDYGYRSGTSINGGFSISGTGNAAGNAAGVRSVSRVSRVSSKDDVSSQRQRSRSSSSRRQRHSYHEDYRNYHQYQQQQLLQLHILQQQQLQQQHAIFPQVNNNNTARSQSGRSATGSNSSRIKNSNYNNTGTSNNNNFSSSGNNASSSSRYLSPPRCFLSSNMNHMEGTGSTEQQHHPMCIRHLSREDGFNFANYGTNTNYGTIPEGEEGGDRSSASDGTSAVGGVGGVPNTCMSDRYRDKDREFPLPYGSNRRAYNTTVSCKYTHNINSNSNMNNNNYRYDDIRRLSSRSRDSRDGGDNHSHGARSSSAGGGGGGFENIPASIPRMTVREYNKTVVPLALPTLLADGEALAVNSDQDEIHDRRRGNSGYDVEEGGGNIDDDTMEEGVEGNHNSSSNRNKDGVYYHTDRDCTVCSNSNTTNNISSSKDFGNSGNGSSSSISRLFNSNITNISNVVFSSYNNNINRTSRCNREEDKDDVEEEMDDEE